MVRSPQPQLSETTPNTPRRWTVIASGLLLFAIALIVVYSGSSAFHSPVAAVVLAAIGLAAVLLQLRLKQHGSGNVRVPQWLNVIGIIFAIGALFSDHLHLTASWAQVVALGAVGCFAVSSFIVLDRIRRSRAVAK